MVTLNYYNCCFYTDTPSVPFKFFIARQSVIEGNFMVDPNNVLISVFNKIKNIQINLGIVAPHKDKIRFYFSETAMGNTRSSRNSLYMEAARNYLLDFYKHALSLNHLLKLAGATIVNTKESSLDIDLSPESLEKDTIINLLKKETL